VQDKRFHPEFLTAEGFEAVGSESHDSLQALIEAHVERSGSGLARRMLADWPGSSRGFVRLTPKPQV
jgi:glutamate synthase (ferredoxin)